MSCGSAIPNQQAAQATEANTPTQAIAIAQDTAAAPPTATNLPPTAAPATAPPTATNLPPTAAPATAPPTATSLPPTAIPPTESAPATAAPPAPTSGQTEAAPTADIKPTLQAAPNTSAAASQVEVIVDANQRYQTIQGFGATHLSLVYVGGVGDTLGANLRQQAIQAVYQQVGISMGNLEIGAVETPGGYDQRANDNDDPFAFNPSGFDWRSSDAIKQQVLDLAQPLGFDNFYVAGKINTRYGSPWLEALRTTNRERYLDEAAEQVAAVAIHWRDSYGIVPRYYMLFNEPLKGNKELAGAWFSEVVDITKRAGARLRQEGFDQMLFVVPADETESDSLELAKAILADSEARKYVGAIAYHTYPYGSTYAKIANILATSGSGKPDAGRIQVRNQLRDLGKTYGLPVWMTEVSHGEVSAISFDNLRGRAIHIHDEMVYANASAYFGMNNYWDTTSQQLHFNNNDIFSEDGTIVLVDNPTNKVYITGMGYAIGHYARWVKRGAVRVEASSSDPLVQVTAFKDDQQGRVVLVLINNATSTRSITVRANDVTLGGELTGEQSTAQAAWQPLTPFAPSDTGFTLTLPAQSVTTIAGQVGSGGGTTEKELLYVALLLKV